MNALKIVLSPEEQAELSRRARSAAISQRDDRRAQVIPRAAQGSSRIEIARLTGLSLPTITCWCQRFQSLRLDGVPDKPGRGRKTSLPAEAVCRVLEQVTQPRIGEPRWSCGSMARVAEISATSVHKLWAANNLKAHLTSAFKLSRDPHLEENFWDVIGLYLDPPIRRWCSATMKNQVQALQRTLFGPPLRIGHIRTQSLDYISHGTAT